MEETERKEIASKLYSQLEKHMSYLYLRWLDEQEYEDIKNYSLSIKEQVKKVGGRFLKMSKRPFGFTYILSDATYQVSINGTSYSYKRIK
jgi:hypothetical protein